MKSTNKKTNQQSILNFFNSACKVSGTKRTFNEMAGGESQTSLLKTPTTNQSVINIGINILLKFSRPIQVTEKKT